MIERMNMWLGLIVFVVGLAVVLWQAWDSYQDGTFTPTQMQKKHGPGLPFLAHGGMWGDIFIISPLAGILVALYAGEWGTQSILLALCAGAAISFCMHALYLRQPFASPHIQHHHLTRAGWWHAVYMTGALAIFLLFYLGTPHPASGLVWATTALLILHLLAGNNMILGLVAPRWYPDRPLKNVLVWGLILAGAAALIVRSFYIG